MSIWPLQLQNFCRVKPAFVKVTYRSEQKLFGFYKTIQKAKNQGKNGCSNKHASFLPPVRGRTFNIRWGSQVFIPLVRCCSYGELKGLRQRSSQAMNDLPCHHHFLENFVLIVPIGGRLKKLRVPHKHSSECESSVSFKLGGGVCREPAKHPHTHCLDD